MSDQKRAHVASVERASRYDDIDGGVAPSPFVSIFFVIAIVSAVGAATFGPVATETSHGLWTLAAITTVITVLFAAFASPSE